MSILFYRFKPITVLVSQIKQKKTICKQNDVNGLKQNKFLNDNKQEMSSSSR